MVRIVCGLLVLACAVILSGCCAPAQRAQAGIADKDLELLNKKDRAKRQDGAKLDKEAGGDKKPLKAEAPVKKRDKEVDKIESADKEVGDKKTKKANDQTLKKQMAGLVPKTKLPSAKKNQLGTMSKLKLLRVVKEIEAPQSISFDPKRLRFYFSRLGSSENPGDGAIGLLARDGSLINSNWVKGLKQPRGLAVRGDYLYVADGAALVEIEIGSERISNRFEVDGGIYLNDVALSKDGIIYVTEPLGNAIYSLDKKGKFQRFIKSEKLNGPNSLSVMGGDIYLGSIGLAKETKGQEAKSASPPQGGLYKINIAKKSIRKLSKGDGEPLSGVAINGQGRLFASSAQNSDLLTYDIATGTLLSRRKVDRITELNRPHALGDFIYFKGSKEFWMPIKSNGLILVFVESGASLSLDEGVAK